MHHNDALHEVTIMEIQENRKRKRIAARIFWGLLFLAAAAAIILNQLGLVVIGSLSGGEIFWLVVLLIALVASIPYLFWFGIFFPAAGIVYIFRDEIGFAPFNLWAGLGVALLLSIGFSILFHRHGAHSFGRKHGGAFCYTKVGGQEPFERVVDTGDGREVCESAHFGAIIKYVNSENFERAALDCSFGSMKVYFDNATPAGEELIISINLSFGAIALFIPKEWRVIDSMSNSFSGVKEINAKRNAEERIRAILTGSASFAGIEIIYV
jgi:predicted membrane protein